MINAPFKVPILDINFQKTCDNHTTHNYIIIYNINNICDSEKNGAHQTVYILEIKRSDKGPVIIELV